MMVNNTDVETPEFDCKPKLDINCKKKKTSDLVFLPHLVIVLLRIVVLWDCIIWNAKIETLTFP